MIASADIDRARCRQVLAHLPAGVTVITAHGRDGRVGMAASSVTSVSLDPPLILFCPAKSSGTWSKIRSVGAFCFNVKASHRERLARQFAGKEVDRLSCVYCEHRPTGPAPAGAVAWIECHLQHTHEAGDHRIVLVRAVAIEAAAGVEPCVSFRGSLGSFRAPDTTGGRDSGAGRSGAP